MCFSRSISSPLDASQGKKAQEEAAKLGCKVNVAAKGDNKSIPPVDSWNLSPDSKYVHICSNETIQGVEFQDAPDIGGRVLISDMSSNILSRPVDVSKYGVIYCGAQKVRLCPRRPACLLHLSAPLVALVPLPLALPAPPLMLHLPACLKHVRRNAEIMQRAHLNVLRFPPLSSARLTNRPAVEGHHQHVASQGTIHRHHPPNTRHHPSTPSIDSPRASYRRHPCHVPPLRRTSVRPGSPS